LARSGGSPRCSDMSAVGTQADMVCRRNLVTPRLTAANRFSSTGSLDGGDAPSLVAGEQLGRCATTRLVGARSMPRSAAAMKIVRPRSGCGHAILTALLGCIHRGNDHGDRGDRRRARRAPLEDREMSVRSTKTRTAALSVRTRWRPSPWCGRRRPVRSISANSLPIVVWRSIVISRSCSQNSGSTVIDVSRPLILTWCRQLSFQRCLAIAGAAILPAIPSRNGDASLPVWNSVRCWVIWAHLRVPKSVFL
jgi:hypothetical protein